MFSIQCILAKISYQLDFNPIPDSLHVHVPGLSVLPELYHEGQHPGQVEVAGDGVQRVQLTWKQECSISNLSKISRTCDHHHSLAEILPLNTNSSDSDSFQALKKNMPIKRNRNPEEK